MAENQTIKQYLLGCFEISIFMKEGVNHFNDNLSAMWKSFGIVSLTLILIVISTPFIYAAKESLHGISLPSVAMLFILKFIIGSTVTLLFLYMFCKVINRTHNLIKYITASNWASIIPLILFITPLILMKLGPYTYDDVYPALVVISVYAYALTAFVTRYIIDIPWELAIFVTICTMAINEAGFDLLYYTASL